MSLTAAAWLLGLVGFAIASFRRPIYAVGLYLYVFFMFPDLWWWGKAAGLAGHRWSLASGWWVLLLVVMHNARRAGHPFVPTSPVDKAALALLANATLVHVFLAPNWAISADAYLHVAKFVLLYFLIRASIWDRRDLLRMSVILLVCSGYLGYEATINERGSIVHDRLEGIGVPGATGANQLGNLVVTILPVVGVTVLQGHRFLRVIGVLLCPLLLNVLLLVNSRGAFLGAMASALVMLAASARQARRHAFLGVLAGIAALVFLLRDPRIVDRFMTTFTPSGKRDSSASERLVLWRAGLLMVADYPLGSGGHGFKRVRGRVYMPEVGLHYRKRAVHNGYINEACEWGVQGLALKVSMLLGAALLAWRASRRAAAGRRPTDAVLGAALVAGIAGFMVSCIFGDFLDSEWGYWIAAIAVSYAEVEAPVGAVASTAHTLTRGCPTQAIRYT